MGQQKVEGAEEHHPTPGAAHRTLSASGRGKCQRSHGLNTLGFSQGEGGLGSQESRKEGEVEGRHPLLSQ